MKIIIKIGTSTLTDKNGGLNKSYISLLAKNISDLQKEGNEILLVSSGAIRAGMGHLKLKNKPKTLREKQALAAIGQPLIMNAYGEAFGVCGISVAQLLLTRDDFENRMKYINARNTLYELMKNGVIPIINENDTIAVEEINFGDNDTLAALVSAAVDADKLIIFTDVDGLYEGHPSRGLFISRVEKITKDIESFADAKSGSGKGSGGMKTKILAAKIATSSGADTIISNGSNPGMLKRISEEKARCTVFKAKTCRLEAKKSWIAFGKKPKGCIFVDKKAEEALVKKGKSLLAAGINNISGNFKRGDTVAVSEKDSKKEFARGLINYSFEEVLKIKGKNTKEMKKIVSAQEDEVIHRDNLVIL
ncbi:MAG: glutamate 5-kinase [Endomicrobium sp.]|jgi:glutamate 5-kinase|nr:glutamate 5-kinase [Endomicrobium sp.]